MKNMQNNSKNLDFCIKQALFYQVVPIIWRNYRLCFTWNNKNNVKTACFTWNNGENHETAGLRRRRSIPTQTRHERFDLL